MVGDWVYRYNAQRIPGSWEAGITISLVSVVYAFFAGLFIAYYLGAGTYAALVAGLAVSSFMAFIMMRLILNALRPVRYAFLNIIYRILYTSLIVLLVYYMGCGVIGAFWSIIVAGAAAAFLSYEWGRRAKPPSDHWVLVLKEWTRHSFVYIPSTIAHILASLDALVAYRFWGSVAVAAFFATLMIFSLIRESIVAGTSYVATYLLRGGREEKSLQGLVVLLALTIPLLIFIAAHPSHIIFLINPRYTWAQKVIVFHVAYTVVAIFEAYISSLASGSIRGRAIESSKRLLRLNSLVFITRIAYFMLILILAVTVTRKSTALVAWSISLTITSLVLIVGYIGITPSLSYILFKRHTALAIIYIAISYLVARSLRLPSPSPRFLTEIRILIAPFTIYTIITYIIIALITPELRQALKHILRQT